MRSSVFNNNHFFALVFLLLLACTAPAHGQSASPGSESSLEWLERISQTEADDPALREEIAALKNATDPESLARLGYLYDNGIGMERDRKRAYEQYILPASHRGSTLGKYLNAHFRLQDHSFGSSLYPAKPWLAVELLTSSAEEGFVLSQFTLGDLLFSDIIDSPDHSEGLKWLTRAAEQDYSPAMYAVGNVYNQGLGVDQDTDKAQNWYLKAAEAGYTPAMVSLGHLLPSEQKTEEGLAWVRKAAEAGYYEAQYLMGNIYNQGSVVERSEERAVLWWERAANQGYLDAVNKLYYHYRYSDPDLAVQWLGIAVEAGNREALMMSAELLEESDPDRAITYLKRYLSTTTPDDPSPLDAYYRLAKIYEDRGEYGQAFEYLKKVGENFNEYDGYLLDDAFLELATYYLEGKAGVRNLAEAREWLRRGHGEFNDISTDEIFELFHDNYPADAGGWVEWTTGQTGSTYYYHPHTHILYNRPTIDFRGFQVLVKIVRPSGSVEVRGWVYDDRDVDIIAAGTIYRYGSGSSGYPYLGEEDVKRARYSNPREPDTIQNEFIKELWD